MRLSVVLAVLTVVAAKQCPASEYSCPDDATCCKLEDGEWGCCPMANAVCCDDRVHCCPDGSRCDTSASKCILKSGFTTPLFKKARAEKKSKNELCPDKRYTCPQGTTCCLLQQGKYGCCPDPDAVCCEDHLHCCPHGTQCDTKRARCVNNEGWEAVPWLRKTEATFVDDSYESSESDEIVTYDDIEREITMKVIQETNDYNEVICPDRKSKCPTGTTCCLLQQGRYGCCPAEGATCCADHLHCCPHGTLCDPTGQRCVNQEGWNAVPWLTKFPSTSIRNKPAIEVHHPHEHVEKEHLPSELRPIGCGYKKTCPAMTTCCAVQRIGKIHHMCCPLQNAVCCESSCCPAGFHCLPGGRCEKKARHFQNWINN